MERRSFLKVLLAVVAAPLAGFAAVRPKPFTGWKGHYDPPISVVTPEWDALGYPHLDDSNQWIVTYASGQSQIVRWDSETTGLALGGASVHTIKPAADSATGVCG